MKKIIKIEGMMCDKCVRRVKDKLESINNIDKVNVSLEDKEAIVELSNELDSNYLKEIIDDLGYEVISIK